MFPFLTFLHLHGFLGIFFFFFLYLQFILPNWIVLVEFNLLFYIFLLISKTEMPDPNRELTERRPEEITTLHISKLPDDFKERELFLLYGSMPGFQNGQIAYAAPGRTLGFATFNNRENASGALEKTNGLSWTGAPPEFDLRVGFASSQSRNIKTDQSVSSSRSPVKPDVAGWQQIDNRVISIPHYPQPAYHSLTTLFVRSISEHMTNTQLKSLFQRYVSINHYITTVSSIA